MHNTMRDSTALYEQRLRHYEVEKAYARLILQTPKRSPERRLLFERAYSDVIGNIIEKYNPGGGETNYHDTVAALVRSLSPPNRRGFKRVFDLGCGGGHLLVALAKDGYDVYGIDVSGPSIAEAKRDLAPFFRSEHVQHVDILDYEPPTKFDIVVMDNVIEHLVPDETPDILAKCYDMLNPNGMLIVLTPHSLSGPHDVSKYFVPFGAKAEGFHLKEFSFTEMNEAIRRAGFDEVLGFPFHPRLLRKYHYTPKPSKWAARKCMALERLAQRWPSPQLLRLLGRTSVRALTALAFPTVAVGVKLPPRITEKTGRQKRDQQGDVHSLETWPYSSMPWLAVPLSVRELR